MADFPDSNTIKTPSAFMVICEYACAQRDEEFESPGHTFPGEVK